MPFPKFGPARKITSFNEPAERRPNVLLMRGPAKGVLSIYILSCRVIFIDFWRSPVTNRAGRGGTNGLSPNSHTNEGASIGVLADPNIPPITRQSTFGAVPNQTFPCWVSPHTYAWFTFGLPSLQGGLVDRVTNSVKTLIRLCLCYHFFCKKWFWNLWGVVDICIVR